MVRQRGQANLDVVRDTFMYIPLIESIEQLLQNQDILELVINQPAERMDGFYSDIQTGSVYRQHFQQNQIALPIVLYFDDVEICNPLNKRAGTHNICLLQSCKHTSFISITITSNSFVGGYKKDYNE